MLVSLNLMHLGDVDTQLAYSIRLHGAGPGDSAAPYLELFELLLKKYVLQSAERTMTDLGGCLFIHDLQCSVAAMHGLADQPALASPRAATVVRICGLISQAISELERQIASGLCGVALAAEPRMSLCEDPSVLPPPSAPNFAHVVQHRRTIVQFLDRWNSECEKSPAGATEESKVRAQPAASHACCATPSVCAS
jgi:hypothetical protein